MTIVSGRELDVPKFDYMALKYSAVDFCCALKPYLVSHVVNTTAAARIVFMDADICVFAPMTEMLDQLDSSNFVVIPHRPWHRSPTPNDSGRNRHLATCSMPASSTRVCLDSP